MSDRQYYSEAAYSLIIFDALQGSRLILQTGMADVVFGLRYASVNDGPNEMLLLQGGRQFERAVTSGAMDLRGVGGVVQASGPPTPAATPGPTTPSAGPPSPSPPLTEVHFLKDGRCESVFSSRVLQFNGVWATS